MEVIRGTQWNPKYLYIVTPILMMTMLVNQFLNLKSIDLFGIAIVASILTYPLSLIVCDVMTEVYGYVRTRKIIFLCLFLYVLSMLLVQMAVHFPPAPDYKNNEQYVLLFSSLPQIAIGGVLGYLGGELVNSMIMSRLKIKMEGKLFFFRALLSTGISQIVNCILFFGIGFWGIMSFQTILNSSLISIGLILLYEIIVLPLTYKIAATLKRLENVEYFDQ